MALLHEEKYIWMDGELVPWKDAKIHILSHVIHYGAGFFEGIRCYKTTRGTAVFRLREHLERLLNSAHIYRTESPYTIEEFTEHTLALIRANNMPACYIRPLIYRGYGDIGVFPMNNPVHATIAVWDWGGYLGADAVERGIAVCVSSWTRPSPNSVPTAAKVSGNYINSQLIKMEAVANGFAEGIALDAAGFVSEGSGENLFMVARDTLFTPPMSASILGGVTRSTVFTLAAHLGLQVREESIPREMLYLADELFFTGTAAEISPITSIDHIQVGGGSVGPITKRLQQEFFKITRDGEDPYGWLTWVYESPKS